VTGSTDWIARAEEIAHYFGKGKENSLGDASWMTLCPVHGDSNKPNLHITPVEGKILAHCYVCGEGRKTEIVQALGAQFDLSERKARGPRILKKDERGIWLSPIPTTAPSRPTHCYLGKDGSRVPDSLWAYLDQNGSVLMFNARFNVPEENGTVTKHYRRLALYLSKDAKNPTAAWSWFGPDHSLPLYGLEQLVGEWWKQPVMVVEGEKAADAARELFKNWIVLAYPGGATNFGKVDWTPLLGPGRLAQVTIWPDNDDAGRRMAYGPTSLSNFLSKYKVRAKVVPVFSEVGLPKKWDLADPPPLGWQPDFVYELLAKAEYTNTAEVNRIARYCPTLKRLDISLDTFEELAETGCAAHAESEGSQCQRCPYLGRLEKPNDLRTTPDILLDWVYVTRHKFFHNVSTKEQLDSTAFNNLWASDPGYTLIGPGAASATVLENPTTCKVYDYGYRPNSAAIYIDNNGRKLINVWTGFAFEPDISEPPTPWLELSEYLITDEFIRERIFDWLAYVVQNPGRKINHGLLIISSTQGVGKDSFIEPIREIFGSGNCRDISSRALDSSFNEYLLQTKLLIISELDTIGHRSSTYDYLKPLLAAPPTMLNVNVKGMKQIEIDNVVQVIAFSNKEVPIAIEDNDRRLLVYDIQHKPAGRWTPEKFSDYYAWLRAGGAKRVFAWLLKRDVSAFDASAPAPNTEAKQVMAEGASPVLSQFADMIREFAPPFNADLLRLTEVMDELGKRSGGRTRIKALERYLGNRFDTGRLPGRIVIGDERIVLFACRHYAFWSKQSAETLRRAYREQWSDMRSASGAIASGPSDLAKQNLL
jgi:hypothetical protein